MYVSYLILSTPTTIVDANMQATRSSTKRKAADAADAADVDADADRDAKEATSKKKITSTKRRKKERGGDELHVYTSGTKVVYTYSDFRPFDAEICGDPFTRGKGENHRIMVKISYMDSGMQRERTVNTNDLKLVL